MFLPSRMRGQWKKDAWENCKKKTHVPALWTFGGAREKRFDHHWTSRIESLNEKFIHLEKLFHFIICQGSPRENPNVLISSYLVPILPLGPSSRKQSWAAYFVRESQQIQNKKSLVRVPYHKLLNNLAWSSLNGGYSVVFVRISSRFGRTPATSGLVTALKLG